MTTGRAMIQPPTRHPRLGSLAARADKPIGPPKLGDIAEAIILALKPVDKLLEVAWIVLGQHLKQPFSVIRLQNAILYVVVT